MLNKTILLLIDLQNDFCPGGALAVSEGDQTIEVANLLITHFKSQSAQVLATMDWHPANHGSFASQQGCAPFEQGMLFGLPQTWWPDHCVQYTDGACLHPLLSQEIDQVIYKGTNPQVDSYSAFFDNGQREQTELNHRLKQHKVTDLVVMGLATDYCVKFTVLDALALDYQVTVITDGCRGVNLHAHDSERALEEMQKAGAKLYSLQSWFTDEASLLRF